MAEPSPGEAERVEALNRIIREFVRKHEATHAIDPVAYYRALLRLLEDADPMPNVAKARTQQELALALADAGDGIAARETIDDVVQYFDATLGPDAPETREAEAARDRIGRILR